MNQRVEKIGKYQIREKLGKGGMGIVYEAFDPDINRTVAIKTIRFDLILEEVQKEELMMRFMREAQAAGKLHHPNIITIYDIGREGDLTYIVMQYIEGKSLQQILDSGKKFSPQEIMELLRPIGESLDYAHGQGIIHRDIKPANILIDKHSKPYIVDFGVARIETSTITQTQTTVGTLSYMSPEQVIGNKVDSRSDIFSLGVVLFELFAGQKPFVGDHISTLVYKIVHEEPQKITDINRDLPDKYKQVFDKALAKDPAQRYQNCKELMEALQYPILFYGQTYDTSVARQTEVIDFRKRRKTAVILATILLALILAGAGSYLFFIQKSRETSSFPAEKQQIKTADSEPVSSAGVLLEKKDPEEEEPKVSEESKIPEKSSLVEEKLAKVRESYDRRSYDEAVSLAEEILKEEPENPAAKEYLDKANMQITAAEISSLLQSGIESYNSGEYGRCVQEMERILRLDKGSEEAQKYLFLADTARSKVYILQMIEQFREAEEKEDLLTVLGTLDSPVLAERIQTDYGLLFTAYDDIRSIVSDPSVQFQDRWNASASFSQLLTALYKKDGKRKQVFGGVKNWELKKKGKEWKITDIR